MAMQIIGHKSPLMWNAIIAWQRVTYSAANKLNTYLYNTVITPADSSIHTYSNGGISRILVYLQYRLSGTFCVLVVSLNIVDTGISVLR